MQVTADTSKDVTVVTLTGDIDGKSAAGAQGEILGHLPPQGKLLLDMRGVPYMSSAGLRMMLLVYRQAQAKGSKVALVGLSEDIKDTMSATGFLDYFVTAEGVEEGVAALGA